MLYLCKENGKSVCLEYIDMKKKSNFIKIMLIIFNI